MGDDIRVLHVEDEPDFASVTAEILEDETDRLTVETATDADEGYDRLASNGFDCVVSDYDMPGRNGIEFLHAVRERFPDLPFILFTGRGSESVASEAISAGVTDYLQKESKTEQFTVLANRIVSAVEKCRAEQQLERQNDLFRKAQELADVGAWAYDRKSGRIRWTDQVYEMHGLSTEVEPTFERLAEFYHPQDQPRLNELTRCAVRDGDPYEIEHRFTPADDELRWFRTAADPQLEDDEVVRVRGAVHDITERKRLEATLARKATRLEAVAGVTSRDLQSSLATLADQLALAREECDSDHLDRAEASLAQCDRRAEALLTLARGDEVTQTEAISLRSAVEACRERTDAAESTIRIETDATIRADPVLLGQLLDAFVAAAAADDATETAGATAVTVGVLGEEEGFYAAGEGAALAEAERKRVLAGDATTRTGAQLTVVRQLAEAHGWDVRLTDGEAGRMRVECTGVDLPR